MLAQLALGSMLIVTTTLIHGLFALAGIAFVRRHVERARHRPKDWRAAIIIAGFVLWLFLASVVEIWVWAGFYIRLGALKTLEEALYFSTVTFTTLGYGDIVLDQSWRLLSAFQAANGLFLFGWSTAMVFAVVQHLRLISGRRSRLSRLRSPWRISQPR